MCSCFSALPWAVYPLARRQLHSVLFWFLTFWKRDTWIKLMMIIVQMWQYASDMGSEKCEESLHEVYIASLKDWYIDTICTVHVIVDLSMHNRLEALFSSTVTYTYNIYSRWLGASWHELLTMIVTWVCLTKASAIFFFFLHHVETLISREFPAIWSVTHAHVASHLHCVKCNRNWHHLMECPN